MRNNLLINRPFFFIDLKRSIFMLTSLSLWIFIFLASCSDEEDSPVTPEIIPAKTEFVFPKSGGSETLSVKSNITFDIKSNDESWCRIEASPSTSETVYKYAITVDANNETDDRTTTITLKGSDITQTITIHQTAADGLIVTQKTYEDISGEGARIEVEFTTNGDVTVVSNNSWITEVPMRANMTGQSKLFNIARNFGDPREGSVTFELGELSETITMHQLRGTIPDRGMESDAMTLATKIYAGWNIGNTLESIGGETAWGNPMITEAYFKSIKELGFNAIRIPCSWDQYIESDGNYTIKDSWLERVNEVVGYCMINDMYAILNIHWDGGWLEENCTPEEQAENNKKQHALWTQIANKLNHYDEYLLFAGTNEPNVENSEEMTVLKSYLKTFIDAVRGTGGNNAVRNLIVQGPMTDIEKTEKLFGDLPEDIVPNRLMVEVHYYNPWTFCGLEKDESWGKMAYFWGAYKVPGSDRNATSGDEEEMKSLFAKMKTMFVEKGIPVILGEYGAITLRAGLGQYQEAHDKSRGLYDETVTREAKNHGMVPFYWDTGNVINRNTGEIKDSYAIEGILKGAEEGSFPKL